VTPGESDLDANCIAVVGAGLMGHGIAQIFAQAGRSVFLTDADTEVLKKAIDQIRRNLTYLVELGYLPSEQLEEILGRIEVKANTAEAVATADFVVEAVYEEMAVKHRVLGEIEEFCPVHTIIASNSSSFQIGDMATALTDKRRFLGTHFWNPPYLIPVVEVICGQETSPESVKTTCALLASAGKKTAVVRVDKAGFIGNRLQHALRREAIALVAEGVATPEDVDLVARLSFGLRMPLVGPLEAVDLAGLDLTLAIQRYLLPDLNRDTEPSPLIVAKVEKGELGAKTGRGFFSWTEQTHQDVIRRRDSALLGLLELLGSQGYEI